MSIINKDLSINEVQEGFGVLPIGWYEAKVIDSEIKEGPQGDYIKWTYEMTGKPNRVWDVMSLSNEIAMNRLKSLAAACGHHNPNFIADTEELHGREFMVRLKIEEDETGRYEPKNKATSFKLINGDNTPPQPSAPAQTVSPAAIQKTNKPPQAQQLMPWQK